MSRFVGREKSRKAIEAARTSLREKLLKIVASRSATPADPPNNGDSGSPGRERSRTLLLDPRLGPVNAEELIVAVRARCPDLRIVAFECDTALRELPCQFGNRPHNVSRAEDSPIAIAAAERWKGPKNTAGDAADSNADASEAAVSHEDGVLAISGKPGPRNLTIRSERVEIHLHVPGGHAKPRS